MPGPNKPPGRPQEGPRKPPQRPQEGPCKGIEKSGSIAPHPSRSTLEIKAASRKAPRSRMEGPWSVRPWGSPTRPHGGPRRPSRAPQEGLSEPLEGFRKRKIQGGYWEGAFTKAWGSFRPRGPPGNLLKCVRRRQIRRGPAEGPRKAPGGLHEGRKKREPSGEAPGRPHGAAWPSSKASWKPHEAAMGA